MTLWRQAFIAFLIIALSACGHRRAPDPDRAGDYPIFSPNGEPLSGGPLGRLDCPTALGRWFDRLAHGERLDRDAFLTDARTQFAAMDLDKDGIITPAELAAYRAPYITQQAAERDAANDRADRPGGARPGAPRPGVGRQAGGSSASNRRDPSADRPDPVMSADIRLRNEVSLEDFLAHAERSFATLDKSHAGSLTRAEVLSTCAT